jgi:glycosyltransferase involved in cell wall biosynthesis
MSRRVLFLTHEPPFPPVSGARIRTWNLMRQLNEQGWRVSLFGLVTSEEERTAAAGPLGQLCDEVLLHVLPATRRARYRRLAGALARREAFQSRYFHDAAGAAALRASGLFERADAIVVSLLYMHPYLPPSLDERAVFDTHNSEVHRLGSMVRAAPLSPRGVVARLQAAPVERLERAFTRRAARTIAVSEPERAYFDAIAPGRVDLVPNGVDCSGLAFRAEQPREPELLFVGSMGYGANQDGVGWFTADVLPRLERPGLRFTVVGAGAPRSLQRRLGRAPATTELTGFVERTDPYFDRARVMVVPLRIGGGTRLKILEALARGVPVVSTSLGCEGLDLRHGHDLLVGDGPEAFATAVGELLDDDRRCRELAERGVATVRSRYDWPLVGRQLAEALERVQAAVPAATAPGA